MQYLFKVPNNEQGREFLKLAKQFINRKDFALKKRGRGKNRKLVALKAGYELNHCKDIRIPFADYYAVYLQRKDLAKDKTEIY